ncbi:MAG: Ldh family oxidoreductase [Armatimonadetes bacterium]|nr:Ldh family oxidoreductase [Armatimonadota bacterium]
MSSTVSEAVRVMPATLRAFTTELVTRAGVAAEPAAWLAATLVANDQRGVLSHGTAQLRRYVGQYRRGHLNPAPSGSTAGGTSTRPRP